LLYSRILSVFGIHIDKIHLRHERISARADVLRHHLTCTPDSVRRDLGPMRHDLADSASTFADVETNH